MLTDQEIEDIGKEHAPYVDQKFARAIESAAIDAFMARTGKYLTNDASREAAIADASAPLLERIAELNEEVERFRKHALNEKAARQDLERQLEEARKDAMGKAADICDSLPAPPSCSVLERNLWDVATVAAADAIRAAITKEHPNG